MDISAILKRVDILLREKGISKATFYNDCGLTSSAVSQWRTGRTVPSQGSLQRISDYLKVTYEYLIAGVPLKEETPVPSKKDERKIEYDDFTYAMQGEVKDLTEMDKQILLSMAKQLNDARKKDGKT